MSVKMLSRIKERAGPGSFLFPAGALFIILNWVHLIPYAVTAPQDFYRYHDFAASLTGFRMPEGMIIPPLVPLLNFLLGSLLKPFFTASDPFILAGSIISLVSGIALVLYTFKLLEKICPAAAWPGVFTLFASPMFFSFLNWPITELPFLLLVILSFYAMADPGKKESWFFVSLAVLTRFEGILLIFSRILNSARFRMKHLGLYLALGLLLFVNGFYFAAKYFGRIILKVQFMFQRGNFFFFFTHPGELKTVITQNILFFITPGSYPLLTDVLFWMFVVFVVSGSFMLYRRNRALFISLAIYLFLFLLFKGYVVDEGTGLSHTRRLLSFLFILNLIAVTGAYHLYRLLRGKTGGRVFLFIPAAGLAIVCVFSNFSRVPAGISAVLVLLTVSAMAMVLKKWRLPEKVFFIAVFTFFIFMMHSTALKYSGAFLSASSARGGYAIGQWIRANLNGDEKIWVFSNQYVIKYLAGDRPGIITDKFPYWGKNIPRSEYMKAFYRRVKSSGVDYIAFDGSLPVKSREDRRHIKQMLIRERKRPGWFRVKKDIMFRGRFSATVLEPKDKDE